MTNWLIGLFVHSLSVFTVTQILTSVQIRNVTIAVVVALVYGVLKMLFRGGTCHPVVAGDDSNAGAVLVCD